MSEKQRTDVAKTGSMQETLDEHRACMQRVSDLEACLDCHPEDSDRWVARLLEHLPPLARTMREHFQDEEGGDLFSDLSLRRPWIVARLESLKEEHPQLLQEIEKIIDVAGKMRAAEIYELRELNARIQLFVARLRRHEAAENELIFEVYWDDFGVGD
jgi:uncharacterized protein (UPF0335 family)